jgi:hypothetical protein
MAADAAKLSASSNAGRIAVGAQIERRLGERDHGEHHRLDVDGPLEGPPVRARHPQLGGAGGVAHAQHLARRRGLAGALHRLQRARGIDVDDHHPRRIAQRAHPQHRERRVHHREAALAQGSRDRGPIGRRDRHQDGVHAPRVRVGDVELRHGLGVSPAAGWRDLSVLCAACQRAPARGPGMVQIGP